MVSKTMVWNFEREIKEPAGPLQTCTGHGAGAETAIHAIRQIFEEESSDAVLLIDASNVCIYQ